MSIMKIKIIKTTTTTILMMGEGGRKGVCVRDEFIPEMIITIITVMRVINIKLYSMKFQSKLLNEKI